MVKYVEMATVEPLPSTKYELVLLTTFETTPAVAIKAPDNPVGSVTVPVNDGEANGA